MMLFTGGIKKGAGTGCKSESCVSKPDNETTTKNAKLPALLTLRESASKRRDARRDGRVNKHRDSIILNQCFPK